MKLDRSARSTTSPKESLISIREALDVLRGKWKIPIMMTLAQGSKRFRQIQHDIEGITSKVLSNQLKELERNNLVTRTFSGDSDIVLYSVTSKCKSLEKVIEGLKEWGDYHRSNIFQRPINTRSIVPFGKFNDEHPVASEQESGVSGRA